MPGTNIASTVHDPRLRHIHPQELWHQAAGNVLVKDVGSDVYVERLPGTAAYDDRLRTEYIPADSVTPKQSV